METQILDRKMLLGKLASGIIKESLEEKMEYKQVNDKNSTNQQAEEIINNYGLSYSEVKEIALDVFKNNFYQLSAEANQLVLERAKKFIEDYIEKLIKENPSGLKKCKDPDFQYVLFDAQKNYARSGDGDQEMLLINLLVERSKQDERNTLQIVLNESISVINKLTQRQIDLLSFIYLIRYTKYSLGPTINDLVSYFTQFFMPIVNGVSENYTDIQHLLYTGCGTESIGSVDIYKILKDRYPGIFSKGFSKNEYEKLKMQKDLSDSLFRQDSVIEDKYFICATTYDELDGIASMHGFNTGDKNKLNNLLKQSLMSEDDVKKIIRDNCNFMLEPMEIFNKTKISQFLLSSVGISIGYANLKQKLGSFSDLSIWIK